MLLGSVVSGERDLPPPPKKKVGILIWNRGCPPERGSTIPEWVHSFKCVPPLLFRYTGHYFVTTLIYSVLLGFLGMDRFCLGHTGKDETLV